MLGWQARLVGFRRQIRLRGEESLELKKVLIYQSQRGDKCN